MEGGGGGVSGYIPGLKQSPFRTVDKAIYQPGQYPFNNDYMTLTPFQQSRVGWGLTKEKNTLILKQRVFPLHLQHKTYVCLNERMSTFRL